jgi:hypothetical protein
MGVEVDITLYTNIHTKHHKTWGRSGHHSAQLPVAHAQNILSDRITSGHMTNVTSGHAQWSDPRTIPGKRVFVRPHIMALTGSMFCTCPAFSQRFFS